MIGSDFSENFDSMTCTDFDGLDCVKNLMAYKMNLLS